MPDFQLRFQKDMVYVSHWDTEKRKRIEKKKTDQVLSDVLQFPIHGFNSTFGEFFSFIIRERKLMERIFTAATYGHPLEPYIAEIAKPPGDPEELERVEVYWNAQIQDGDLEIATGFHGWGKYKVDPAADKDAPKAGGYAIEFTPLNEYKMLPFILDTDFEIWDIKKPEKPIIAKAERLFTPYDVIRAILWEITWAGDISKTKRGCLVCAKKAEKSGDEDVRCALHTPKEEKKKK